MVAKLREKPGGDRIPVTMGDFADVPVEGVFSLVFVAFNTLFALATQEDQVRCFANAAAHLAEGGVFLIEAFVPDLARFDRNQRFQTNSVSPTEVNLDASRHDPLEQRIDSVHVVLTEAGTRLYPVNLRYAFPSRARPDGAPRGARARGSVGRLAPRGVHAPEPAPRLGVRPVNGPVRVACVQAEPVDPRPRGDARQARRADRRGEGERRAARRLPGDVHPGVPELGVGEVPRRLGRPAREGRVRAARPRVGRGAGAGCRPPRRDRARARGLARHRRERARPLPLEHALQRAPLPRARRQPGAPPPQARPDEPRAADLGPGRRRRPARHPDRDRPDRRADLLGELHAARPLRAVRVRGRDLHRLDRRRRRRVAGDARPHRAGVARVRRRAVPLPARLVVPRGLPAARGDRRNSTCSAAAARRSSRRTAPTSPARSTTRRASSTPTSSPRGSTRSASASTRPATTTGRTCSSCASPHGAGNPGRRRERPPLAVAEHRAGRRSSTLVRRWAEATGAHALVVFDGDPPEAGEHADGEGRRHEEGERRRPDRPRRREARPAGPALPARHLGPRPARAGPASTAEDLVGGGTFVRTLRAAVAHQRSQCTIESSGARTAGLKSVPSV